MTKRDKTNAIVAGGLRSVAASFPLFASVAQAWGEFENSRRVSRIQKFFEDLQEQVSVLSQKIDRMAEDTPELLERTLGFVQSEASEKKRRRFASVFLQCASSTKTADERRTIIDTLDSLTEEDIDVFKVFEPGKALRIAVLERRFDLGLLVKVLSRLESRGLVGQTSGDSSFVYVGPRDYWKNRWRPRYYELLPFGEEFGQMLKQTNV